MKFIKSDMVVKKMLDEIGNAMEAEASAKGIQEKKSLRIRRETILECIEIVKSEPFIEMFFHYSDGTVKK